MDYTTKDTVFEARRNSTVEYEDHPFQPSPVTVASKRENKEEQPPRIVCRNLKVRLLHGKDRMFERDESRRTEGRGSGLQI
jgi:hypothetical protein